MSVDATLKQRGERYGDFSEHARVAQCLQDSMREILPDGWRRLNNVQRQALTVIADKIARILSGDPNYTDNWHDIQGYARLVEERLPKLEPVELSPEFKAAPANDNQPECGGGLACDTCIRHGRCLVKYPNG